MLAPKVRNILQFPNEVLQLIFSQLPIHWNISESCSRFYNVSCEMKLFSIKLNTSSQRDSCMKILDDEALYDSIFSSRRRIVRLEISDGQEQFKIHTFSEKQIDRLTSFFLRFGDDIKYLALEQIKITPEFLTLLNHAPKLEKLKLKSCTGVEYFVGKRFELNLHELREIESFECFHDLLRSFSHLPNNVLRKVYCVFSHGTFSGDPIFRNQHVIEDIETNTNLSNIIDIGKQQMAFKTLNFSDLHQVENLQVTIAGQSKLRKLHVNYMPNGGLPLICQELPFLQDLKIKLRENQFKDMAELYKLESLRTFDLFLDSRESERFDRLLPLLKLRNLHELNLRAIYQTDRNVDISASTFKTMEVNMPQLRKIFYKSNSSIHVLNSILQNLANLESLKFDNRSRHTEDNFMFHEGTHHDKLKELAILTRFDYDDDLAELVVSCKNLERLTTTMCRNADNLKDVLSMQPKLRYVHLVNPISHKRIITRNVIAKIIMHGKKLRQFHSDYNSLEGITADQVRYKFKDQFAFCALGRAGTPFGLFLTNDKTEADRHETSASRYRCETTFDGSIQNIYELLFNRLRNHAGNLPML